MAPARNPDAARLEAAATTLLADPALGSAGPGEAALLHRLRYDDGDAAAAAPRARMLRAAAHLRRMFLLPVPDAPGLVFFAGEADPAALDATLSGMPVGSVGGSGLTPSHAFEACVGEGVEYLSQFCLQQDGIQRRSVAGSEMPRDAVTRHLIAEVLESCGVASDQAIGWIPVRSLISGTVTGFPVDLCLRQPPGQRDFVPPLKLSTGCAAGVSMDTATLRAVLELIERDAAALWWRGGRAGRAIGAECEAGRVGAELLAQLRLGNNGRRSWLLDITSDIGIPVVAAISAGPDGHGFAFGLGCRLGQPEAARAAIFEMCQVELGPHVVAAKRQEAGDDALQEGDLRHLRRSTLIDTRSCPLLRPSGVAEAALAGFPTEPAAAVQFIARRLAEHGIEAFSMDLTRAAFGIPVVRVLAPGLQLEPCRIVTARLASAIESTGGGAKHTGGLALL